MPKTASGLVIPETRKFSYQSGFTTVVYEISTGKATEGGEPKVYVSRWQAQQLALSKGYRLPRMWETWNAVLHDQETKQSFSSWPAEWQAELLLSPKAPRQTKDYLLKDADRNEADLGVSNVWRLLVPIGEGLDGERTIVVATVFDLPDYKSGEFRYNPVYPGTWNRVTGFFNFEALGEEGPNYVFLTSGNYLHAVRLRPDGYADCDWGPEYSDGDVGFRGVVNSQSGQVKLVEAPMKESRNAEILEELEGLRTHYLSAHREIDAGLEKLDALERRLREE